MRINLQRLYSVITESFWFVPTVMAALAALGALGSVALDEQLSEDFINNAGWIWSGSATGARSVLSVVAGSVMTVVSIVFSITMAALAQMSSQYGPRVLRNFTSDRSTQITLGTFIATFTYSLMVLRTVRSVEENAFAPHLSVTVGVGMAIASLGILIYFIHHVSQTLQVENIVAGVGREFQRLLPNIMPERIAHSEANDSAETAGSGTATSERLRQIDWSDASAVVSKKEGYLQRVDDGQLMAVATRCDLVLHVLKRPGDFITQKEELVLAWPAARTDERAREQLQECFGLGKTRTPHQDLSYPIQQLVEIALHALSPGINEPFTAITCIDWLGASLRSVLVRRIPASRRFDEQGALRVMAEPLRFDELAAASFHQIRLYGANNAAVNVHLLDTIASLAPYVVRPEDRRALLHHVTLIEEDAAQVPNASDRQRVENQVRQALLQLSEQPTE